MGAKKRTIKCLSPKWKIMEDVFCTQVILYEFNQLENKKFLNVPSKICLRCLLLTRGDPREPTATWFRLVRMTTAFGQGSNYFGGD